MKLSMGPATIIPIAHEIEVQSRGESFEPFITIDRCVRASYLTNLLLKLTTVKGQLKKYSGKCGKLIKIRKPLICLLICM